jgi:hypothetical protein
MGGDGTRVRSGRRPATRGGPSVQRAAAVVCTAALAALAGSLDAPRAVGGGFGTAGVFCDSCPDPIVNVFGIEFRRGDFWTVGFDGTLTRLDHCQPVEVVSVQGFRGVASSLCWDSRRDQFVVTDALLEEISVIDLRGNILRAFPAPGSGSIGAAYDSTRDVYWITDFETRSLYSLDPTTGAVINSFHLTRAVRIAGAAYDRAHDAIIYQDRIFDTKGYLVSCANGAAIDSFPLPYMGLNGWEDNALAPDGSLWIHEYEERKSYCIDRHTTPTRRKTWGALKRLYR